MYWLLLSRDSLFFYIYSIITWHSAFWNSHQYEEYSRRKRKENWIFSNKNSASSFTHKSSDCQLELSVNHVDKMNKKKFNRNTWNAASNNVSDLFQQLTLKCQWMNQHLISTFAQWTYKSEIFHFWSWKWTNLQQKIFPIK